MMNYYKECRMKTEKKKNRMRAEKNGLYSSQPLGEPVRPSRPSAKVPEPVVETTESGADITGEPETEQKSADDPFRSVSTPIDNDGGTRRIQT